MPESPTATRVTSVTVTHNSQAVFPAMLRSVWETVRCALVDNASQIRTALQELARLRGVLTAITRKPEFR